MKYTTSNKNRAMARAILLCVLAVITIIHGVMVLERAEAKRVRWEPDCEFPMANANISWEQTYYPGGITK